MMWVHSDGSMSSGNIFPMPGRYHAQFSKSTGIWNSDVLKPCHFTNYIYVGYYKRFRTIILLTANTFVVSYLTASTRNARHRSCSWKVGRCCCCCRISRWCGFRVVSTTSYTNICTSPKVFLRSAPDATSAIRVCSPAIGSSICPLR